MDVVIVESPAKAKTINKYLGSNYEVFASYGHVRDLPAKDGSVDPDADFNMLWAVDPKAQKRLSDIAAAVKNADRLILATDPDREGEAISWHVLEVLRQKKALKSQAIQRVVFNAITKQSILDAMKNPREIDSALVEAYLARRALDYLVGFTLSPVLWRKLPGSRSAGRVQSVALRLICERDREIEAFVSQEYWSLEATLKTVKGESFESRLTVADGEKIGRLDIKDEASALALKASLEKARFSVANTESKPTKRNPYPPFTTSTLQQEASRKLGFSASRTMQTAQKLYEGVSIGGDTVGLITYMRTDGVQITPEAVNAVRKHIQGEYGERYLPNAPRLYKTKAKNAQEAHEAIRPTDPGRTPQEMRRYVDGDLWALYELIWKRTIASQMESAELQRTTIDIDAHTDRQIQLRATGSVVTFDGFLTLYQESKDDDDGDDENRRLPMLREGDALEREAIKANQHFTEPPPHFSEASLVKRMEELGIGRPSTYAATLSVLGDRGYVRTEKKRLIAEDKGRLVIAFLENFFHRYVEYDFTASLEEKLDLISNNEVDWRKVLRDFWDEFIAAVNATKELRVAQVIDALNDTLAPHIFPPREDGTDPRSCPSCSNGQLSLKLGRYGSFIGCSNYPECNFTRQLDANGESGDSPMLEGPTPLGKDPQTGEEVSLRDGRFGPYVQLGEGAKPKRASIPRTWPVDSIDIEKALQLLSLPREVGKHPETGEMIMANIGRYGPYIQLDKTYANLESVDEVFEIGINRAVTVLAEKKEKGGRGGRAAPAGRVLGAHPDGGDVTVRPGRFGPYVNYAKINATLPKGTDPEAITLEEALVLIAAKADAAPSAKKTTRKAPAKKAASSKEKAEKAPKKAKAAPKTTKAKKAKPDA